MGDVVQLPTRRRVEERQPKISTVFPTASETQETLQSIEWADREVEAACRSLFDAVATLETIVRIVAQTHEFVESTGVLRQRDEMQALAGRLQFEF